jgi:hypothetical protein
MFLMGLRNNIIRARGYRLSAGEMRINGIIGVYNAVGEGLSDSFVEKFVSGRYNEKSGQTVIIERNIIDSGSVIVDVVSVIVFRNLYCMQIFALRHSGIYLSGINRFRYFPTLMN